MNARGDWRDNVFVERLWRSVKYEEAYLHAMTQPAKPANRSWSIWIGTTAPDRFYIKEKTLDEVYALMLPTVELVA